MSQTTATPASVKHQIKHWSGRVLYECDVPAEFESGLRTRYVLEQATRIGADLRGAVLSGADLSGADLRDADLTRAVLSGADLSGADLSGADLSDADLTRAVLSGAVLSGADLSGADLSGADLRGAVLSGADLSDADLRGAVLSGADLSGADLRDADLRGAVLSGADLSGADLSGADLRHIKADFFDVLLRAPREVSALRAALVAGRVDGSTYEGECACLVGTIANVRGESYRELGVLKPDSNRPAERWFLGIRKGDTPETNQLSRITVEWVDEFTRLLQSAREVA